MDIINGGSQRAVLDIDDKFLRFVSQDGASEYPTIIMLLNHIFLRDNDRGGEHLGITMKIKAGDDVIWYRVPKESVVDTFKSLFINDVQNESNDDNLITQKPPSPPMPLESLFKEADNLPRITNYFKSNTLYYIIKEGGLFISKISPLDLLASQVYFPSGGSPADNTNNIIDVLTLTENKDIILTKNYLYICNENYQLITKFKLPQGEARSMCKLKNYFIIASNVGIFIIKNIESDAGINYELITASSDSQFDNGLAIDNNFTYSFPVPNTNTVEVNGNGNVSCVFNCDTKMGQEGQKLNILKSAHFNSEPILFTTDSVFDSRNNIYKIGNATKYFVFNDFIFIIEDTSSINVFLNNSPNKKLNFSFTDKINFIYMDNQAMYLISENKSYRSYAGKIDNITIFFVLFNYEEFKMKEELGESIKEIDIRTTSPTIFSFLDILKGNNKTVQGQSQPQNENENNNSFNGLDVTGVDFIFNITGSEDKRTWTIIGDDGRRDETFKKMAEAFDIG
jgi:hypothetical protein